MYSIVGACIYIIYICIYMSSNIHVYVCLYINERNDIKDTKDKRKEIGLLCFKILTLPVKWFSVIWKMAWRSDVTKMVEMRPQSLSSHKNQQLFCYPWKKYWESSEIYKRTHINNLTKSGIKYKIKMRSFAIRKKKKQKFWGWRIQ